MPSEKLGSLVSELLRSAEKAADVARKLRASILFQSIVEEKSDEKGKNQRFAHDFKTLADVLIQEMVRHDLTTRIPDISHDCVKGEEDSTIKNAEGESIQLVIGPQRDDTYKVLCRALDGEEELAHTLADAVHREDVQVPRDAKLDGLTGAFDTDDIGIWIDPIDGTNEYIKGGYTAQSATGIAEGGLEVATVLIGAYLKSTGQPVAGVVAQPFDELHPGRSRTFWGVAHGSVRAFGSHPDAGSEDGESESERPEKKARTEPTLATVVLSSSESQEFKDACAAKAKGSGYKLLCVITGKASAYVLSGNSAFKWDTCAPHAILRSKGGDVVDLHGNPVLYNRPNATEPLWSNDGGLLAYSDPQLLPELLQIGKTGK